MSFLEFFAVSIILIIALTGIMIWRSSNRDKMEKQKAEETKNLIIKKSKEIALNVLNLLGISPETKYFQWTTAQWGNDLMSEQGYMGFADYDMFRKNMSLKHIKYDVFFFDAKIPYFVFFDRNNNRCEKILLSEITDVNMRTICNSTSTSQTTRDGVLSRSIIGGVVAGGVGAVIGGTTANETTSTQTQNYLEQLWITITTTNVEFNTIRIYLYSIQEAENAIGTIKAIKAKYEE